MLFHPAIFRQPSQRKGLATAGFSLVVSVMMLAFSLSGGAFQALATQPASETKLPDPLANKRMLTRLASGTVRYFKYPDKINAPVDFSFFDEKGVKHSMSEWRGKTVLLNFWAPWCDSCRRELPSMDKLRTRLDNQKFEIVLINIEEDVKVGRSYLDKLGIKNLISMLDKDKTVLKKLGAIGIPTNILFDCHGRELGRLRGSAAWHADSAILLTKGLMRASGCYDEKQDIL